MVEKKRIFVPLGTKHFIEVDETEVPIQELKEKTNVDSFTYRIGSCNSHIGRPPRFFHNSKLLGSGNRFASVYAVTEETATAIEDEAGTAAGFRGIVWSSRLWVDFDQAEPAQRAEQVLKEMELNYVKYDTGNRGCHFGISRRTNPSHVLPMQDKAWVQQNLPGADLSLYWHLHLIRMPGTLHEKTGLPKRLVQRVQGRFALSLPAYVPESARSSVQEQHSPSNSPLRGSVFKCWAVASQLTENPGMSRHRHLVLLAAALRGEGRASFDDATWVILEVNRGFSEPKPEEEVMSILRWTYGQE